MCQSAQPSNRPSLDPESRPYRFDLAVYCQLAHEKGDSAFLPWINPAGVLHAMNELHYPFIRDALRLTDIAGSGLNMACRDVLRNASEQVRIIGPVLQEEADILHQSYWNSAGNRAP